METKTDSSTEEYQAKKPKTIPKPENTSVSESKVIAWMISETEWYVKIPAQYRQFTGAYRVASIHRESGTVTHYVYRVDAKQLKELNTIIELIKKVAV